MATRRSRDRAEPIALRCSTATVSVFCHVKLFPGQAVDKRERDRRDGCGAVDKRERVRGDGCGAVDKRERVRRDGGGAVDKRERVHRDGCGADGPHIARLLAPPPRRTQR